MVTAKDEEMDVGLDKIMDEIEIQPGVAGKSRGKVLNYAGMTSDFKKEKNSRSI